MEAFISFYLLLLRRHTHTDTDTDILRETADILCALFDLL